MEDDRTRQSWVDTFVQLASEFGEKNRQLSEAIADMPSRDVILFLQRHADVTINAFRNAQSNLFKILREEDYNLESIRHLFIEISRRFDELQILFFAVMEQLDRADNAEAGSSG